MSYRKQHGAVSIFLVIILVPCLVFTSVFVDLGRSHMSKAMAESSGDLALHTLLTNYDGDLNEYYGMMASVQEIDQYYSTASYSFLRSMLSIPVDKAETFTIADYFNASFNDTKISNLLACEVLTSPTSIVGPVAGANLTNAALLKVQVVEFMKYRAPIELAKGVIGRLMGDSDSRREGEAETPSDGAALEEASRDEKDVEYKKNFYEAQGELQAAAFYTYVAIRKYYRDDAPRRVGLDSAGSGALNNADLKLYGELLDDYRETYRELHAQYVKYFASTGGLTKYSHVRLKLEDYQQTDPNKAFQKDKDKLFRSYFETASGEGEAALEITGEDYHALLDDLQEAKDAFNQALAAVAEASQELLANLYGAEEDPNAVNPIQWWVKMNKAINASSGKNLTEEVKKAAEKLMVLYQGAFLAEDVKTSVVEPFPSKPSTPSNQWTEEEKAHQRDVHERAAELLEQTEELQKKYLGQTLGTGDNYLQAVTALEKVSADYWNKLDPSACKVTLQGSQVSVETALSTIGTALTAIREYLQTMVDKLNVAINGDGGNTKSLKELKELARKYRDNLEDWKQEAGKGDTAQKREDTQIINGTLKDENGNPSSMNLNDSAREINAQSVTELSERLTNIKAQFEKLIQAIDSMKYGDARLTEIKTIDDMRKKVGGKVDTDYLAEHWRNGEIADYAETSFQDIIQPNGAHVAELEHLTDNKYNPDIDPSEGNAVQTPKLYVWFHSQWAAVPDDQLDQTQKDKEDAQNASDQQKEDTLNELAKDDPDRVDIKPEFSHGHSFGVLDFLTSIVGLIKTLVSGDFTEIRDDLFALTYMIKMFTFDTFTNEGKFKLLSAEDQNAIGVLTKDLYYEKDEIKQAWADESPEATYNKSLTNKMMCRENNAAWQAELEYILYGESTCKANVRNAYEAILGIRLIINTISAFAIFFTPKQDNPTSLVLETVSDTLAGLTLGIIPPPVWKCLLIIFLSVAETCMDLKRLADGFPVELFKKDQKQFYISVPGAGGLTEFVKNLAAGKDPKPNGSSGIFYSDYLTLFLYMGLVGGGALEEDMYLRMAEVIQANMRRHEEIGPTFTMAKAQVYFKLSATIRVKPLMITLPIFNSPEFENDLDTKTDWCTYSVTTVRGYS